MSKNPFQLFSFFNPPYKKFSARKNEPSLGFVGGLKQIELSILAQCWYLPIQS